MSIEVKVPVLGESVSEASIGQWLKQPGEAVALDEPIVSLETDKVAVEVPAPAAGVMGTHLAKEGDTVAVGALIATIEAGGPATATKAPVANIPAAKADDNSITLSPSVRRAVLEHGIDPGTVTGTGKDGRLTKEDVLSAVATKGAVPVSATPAIASVSAQPEPVEARIPTSDRREERVKMTRLRQTVAKRLKSAQETAALLTTFNDCDMSAVIDARAKYKDVFEKKHGVKLGLMSFFLQLQVLPGMEVETEQISNLKVKLQKELVIN